jgi:dienelactone hydrolase
MKRRHLLLASAGPVCAQPLDQLLAERQAAYRPRLAWRDEAGWRAAALRAARQHIQQPGDDGSRFDTERLAQEDRGDHLAERLSLRMSLGDRADALWLRPKRAGPHPGLLLLHDHGARFDIGAEKLIRPLAGAPQQASAEAWAQRYFDGRFIGEELVRRGYAVLAVDALGWGSRSRPGFARDDQQALAAHLQQLGLHWAGVIASDDARALRWLRERPEVDTQRIGLFGFSMGAFRAWQLAALDDGVHACIAAHWLAPRRDGLLRPGEHTLAGQSAFAMLHPGLAAELDHPDVAALIAPRPLLLFASPEDRLFPFDAVQAMADRLAPAWPQGGLRFERIAGGHRFGIEAQALAWAWLAKQLA